MKRSDLLKSRDYWINEIQNDLYGIMENYMSEKDITRTELANELGVTKGYVSQVLKGDFDHKISKMVDLSLATGKVPFIKFIDLNKYIKDDSDDKFYEIYAIIKPEKIFFTQSKEYHLPYLELIQNNDYVSITQTTTG